MSLVLSRKSGEAIQYTVGNVVFVVRFQMRGSRVHVVNDAPSNVEVKRLELVEPQKQDAEAA